MSAQWRSHLTSLWASTEAETEVTYRIVWKTTPRYMIFSQKKIRIIHEVLKYLCSDNANFMAILSHYIGGRIVFQSIR